MHQQVLTQHPATAHSVGRHTFSLVLSPVHVAPDTYEHQGVLCVIAIAYDSCKYLGHFFAQICELSDGVVGVVVLALCQDT